MAAESEDDVCRRDCRCGRRGLETLTQAAGPNLDFRPDPGTIAHAASELDTQRRGAPDALVVPQVHAACARGDDIGRAVAVEIGGGETARADVRLGAPDKR